MATIGLIRLMQQIFVLSSLTLGPAEHNALAHYLRTGDLSECDRHLRLLDDRVRVYKRRLSIEEGILEATRLQISLPSEEYDRRVRLARQSLYAGSIWLGLTEMKRASFRLARLLVILRSGNK